MAKFIRYALATVCFAGCVGCLALWWRSHYYQFFVARPIAGSGRVFQAAIYSGSAAVGVYPRQISGFPLTAPPNWEFAAVPMNDGILAGDLDVGRMPRFQFIEAGGVYFPLWYPALIFALAGVGVLRFRRQFSIRSALIAVSIVAALLGMVVAL